MEEFGPKSGEPRSFSFLSTDVHQSLMHIDAGSVKQKKARSTLDLSACEQELIHVPGSIQPHGLYSSSTEPDEQSAGNAASLLGHTGSVLGKTAQAVLGTFFAAFLQEKS